MRKLRRGFKPGRVAVVVPNGMLFRDGVCARIKEESAAELDALLPAILDRAFKGEL